jgi:hypothetical protein
MFPSSISLFAVAASAASLRSLPKECSQVSNGYFVEASCQRTTSWVTEFSAQHEVTAAAGAPEQFWINYGFTPDVMVIGYITSDMTAASTVKYGTSSGSYPNVVSGNSTSYTYGKYKSGLIHHVYLTGLTANTKYYYQAGSDASWSQEFTFTSNPGIGANIPYKFAIVADIGENRDANNTITHVLADVDTIDSVIIAGDISYASGCESNGCTTWDAFQTMAAPLGAIKPWHVNIGNHGELTLSRLKSYEFIMTNPTSLSPSALFPLSTLPSLLLSFHYPLPFPFPFPLSALPFIRNIRLC